MGEHDPKLGGQGEPYGMTSEEWERGYAESKRREVERPTCPSCGSKRMDLLTKWSGNTDDYCCQDCFSRFRHGLVRTNPLAIRIETYQDWERLFINGKCVQEHHHIDEGWLHELLVYLGAEVVTAGNDGYPIHDHTDETQDSRDYWDGETFANEDLDDYTPVTERLGDEYADHVVKLDALLRVLTAE